MHVIEDRCLQRAAVVLAAGYHVEVVKQPCSPRVAAEYADSPEIRRLTEAFDQKRPIPIPPKTILDCYGKLIACAKELRRGAL